MSLNTTKISLFLKFVLIIILFIKCECLREVGVWSPSTDPLKVIARFGVGKSDPHHKEDSYGYVFGNMTKHLGPKEKIGSKTSALVIVNREFYLKIRNTYDNYKTDNKFINNSTQSQNGFCEPVFRLIDEKAYDQNCWPKNQMDIIRYVPCLEGGLCDGALNSSQIVENYQFTYIIENQMEPTFWLLLLIACYRDFKTSDSSHNISCEWRDSSSDYSVIKYDVSLVNGHPNSASKKPLDFDHQFSLIISFEQQFFASVLIALIFGLIMFGFIKYIYIKFISVPKYVSFESISKDKRMAAVNPSDIESITDEIDLSKGKNQKRTNSSASVENDQSTEKPIHLGVQRLEKELKSDVNNTNLLAGSISNTPTEDSVVLIDPETFRLDK